MLLRTGLAHQIHLILQDDDVVQLHDFDGSKMLRRLGLRAGFVARNQQQGGIHDGGSRQHGAHENVVARAVDKASNNPVSIFRKEDWKVGSRNVSQELVTTTTFVSLAGRIHLFVALVAPVVAGPGARGVVALVDLCVGIAQLDGDVSFQLVLESDGLHPRDGLDYRALAVRHMPDGADVDGCLSRDDLGSEGGEGAEVEGGGVGLCGQNWLWRNGLLRAGRLLQGRLDVFDVEIVVGLRLQPRRTRFRFREIDVISQFILVLLRDVVPEHIRFAV